MTKSKKKILILLTLVIFFIFSNISKNFITNKQFLEFNEKDQVQIKQSGIWDLTGSPISIDDDDPKLKLSIVEALTSKTKELKDIHDQQDKLRKGLSGDRHKRLEKQVELGESLILFVNKWKEDVPLFVSHRAILLGAETRTSSPVRIKRNEKFESVNIKNLYPIGEGSGYTGGITSSAADAIKAVERQMQG